MAKVKALGTFVGTSQEMEKYSGQLPANLKKFEKKMSEAEKNSFAGKITVGTEMEVSQKRAKALEELGLVEITEEGEPDEKEETEPAGKDKTGELKVKKVATNDGSKANVHVATISNSKKSK